MATTVWNESVSGNLSNSQSAPTAITLAAGANSVIGTVGGSDTQDWVALTVPAGLQLSNLVLAAYQSTDAQGFTGVQAGSSFVGSVNSAASYLGYAHFGAGATNTGLPTENLIGDDILPIMGSTTNAPGSHGFTPPLAAGTYTFLIQQLGATTNYQFDYERHCGAGTDVSWPACRRSAFISSSAMNRNTCRTYHPSPGSGTFVSLPFLFELN